MTQRFVKSVAPGLLIILGIVFMSFEKRKDQKVEITFYEVPLVCSAAPQIGCGTRSKPILLGLENSPLIKEAWLNRTGTVIAVVWKDRFTSSQKTSATENVFRENRIDMSPISGKKHRELLRDFDETKDWYRGTSVDNLSIEEADIIAKRLVTRVNAKTPLSESLKETLHNRFTSIIKNRLTATYSADINVNESGVSGNLVQNVTDALKEAAKEYLNEKELTALDEAIAQGLRPDEKCKEDCCSPSKKESCSVSDN